MNQTLTLDELTRNVDEGAYDSTAENKMQRRMEDAELLKVFKSDLFEAFGVAKNPKAERAFAIAWDWGHSGGFREVVVYFCELVELIK